MATAASFSPSAAGSVHFPQLAQQTRHWDTGPEEFGGSVPGNPTLVEMTSSEGVQPWAGLLLWKGPKASPLIPGQPSIKPLMPSGILKDICTKRLVETVWRELGLAGRRQHRAQSHLLHQQGTHNYIKNHRNELKSGFSRRFALCIWPPILCFTPVRDFFSEDRRQ